MEMEFETQRSDEFCGSLASQLEEPETESISLMQLSHLNSSEKVPVAVEVLLKSTSAARREDIGLAVERMLEKKSLSCRTGSIPLTEDDDPYILEHVASIFVSDAETEVSVEGEQMGNKDILLFWQVSLRIFVYQLNDEGAGEELNDDEDIASFQDWILPSKEFHGLWESLIFDTDVKQRLIRYAEVALLFADKFVDPNLISWNRVILLHGPPGTGKTSLCKAIAQKLSIRLSKRYSESQLLEINAHSLFSKWFSESGKLVTKLFQKIQSFLEEGDTLVFLLIDEVESLASARQAALSGSEPSDSIRVVNALLTQLDRLKSWPNVIVLTTSNITGAIDIAFVDRADVKAYIGPPSVRARYEILRSCVKELCRVGLLKLASETDIDALESYEAIQSSAQVPEVAQASPLSRALLSVAQITEGLSGRSLRKLPFLAYATRNTSTLPSLSTFLLVLELAAKKHVAENRDVMLQ